MTYSLQRLLLILGLVIIPFYEILLRVLPFVGNHAPDSRAPKEILALVFALSIGLMAVFQGNIKPFRNKFLLFIPLYVLISLIMSPHANLFINSIEVGDFYFWKPFGELLCFSLMIIAIASSDINVDEILEIMVICAGLMSIYVILQKLGLDQFWLSKTGGEFTSVREHALGGNLGQPTIVSSWIVMMIPLSMYLRKYWMVLLMLAACLLTQGAMVIISIISIWIISIFYLWKELRVLIIGLLIGSLIVCGFMLIHHPSLRNKVIDRMDGRFGVWQQIGKDIHDGQIIEGQKFCLTGIGFGRFPFVFTTRHNSTFQQAHNDILEFVYNCGLIGGFILLAGIFWMIFGASINPSPLCLSIMLSFIAIFICSLGSFPFQLGTHQFYSAVLVGFLNNDFIIRRS